MPFVALAIGADEVAVTFIAASSVDAIEAEVMLAVALELDRDSTVEVEVASFEDGAFVVVNARSLLCGAVLDVLSELEGTGSVVSCLIFRRVSCG